MNFEIFAVAYSSNSVAGAIRKSSLLLAQLPDRSTRYKDNCMGKIGSFVNVSKSIMNKAVSQMRSKTNKGTAGRLGNSNVCQQWLYEHKAGSQLERSSYGHRVQNINHSGNRSSDDKVCTQQGDFVGAWPSSLAWRWATVWVKRRYTRQRLGLSGIKRTTFWRALK